MSRVEEPPHPFIKTGQIVKVGDEKQHEIYLSTKAKLQMIESKKTIKQY